MHVALFRKFSLSLVVQRMRYPHQGKHWNWHVQDVVYCHTITLALLPCAGVDIEYAVGLSMMFMLHECDYYLYENIIE
jgi:hypothetical protein